MASKGTIVAPTTLNATVTVPVPSGHTPRLLILWSSSMTAIGLSAGTGGHGRVNFGMVTGDASAIQQAMTSIMMQDDAATLVAWRDNNDTTALRFLSTTGTNQGTLTCTTWAGTGIVLTASTAATSAFVVHYLLLDDRELARARVVTWTMATSVASQNVALPAGWGATDLVMAVQTGKTTQTAAQGNISISLGAALSPTARTSMALSDQQGGTTVLMAAQGQSRLFQIISAGATVTEGDLGTAANDVVPIAFTTQTTTAYVAYLVACQLAAGATATIGRAASNVSPLNLAASGPPTAALLWSLGIPANVALDNSHANLGEFVVGGSDGVNEGYAGYVNDDASTGSRTGTVHKTDKAMGHLTPPSATGNAPVIRYEADSSVSGNNLVLTASTADTAATEMSYLLFTGVPPSGRGPDMRFYQAHTEPSPQTIFA